MLECGPCRKCVWKSVEVCVCITERGRLHSGHSMPLGQAVRLPSATHGKPSPSPPWTPQRREHSGRRVVVLSETSAPSVLLAVPSCQGP